MARWLVGLSGLLCGSALCLGAEPPRVVTLSVTIASGSDARLGLAHDPQALAKAVAELEAANGLSHLARIKFSAVEEQQSHVQFGESVSVIAGRTFGFGGSRGTAPGGPGNPPGSGGPTSIPNFQQQQTGTMVMATARVVESGVLAEFSVEQTRIDKARPAAEDPQAAPPSKPMLMVKSSVTIPRDGTVLLGGFERTADDVTERTVVLVSATASGPPAGAAGAEKQQILQMFSLKRLDGGSVQKTLEEMLVNQPVRIALDARTNSLAVLADKDTLAEIKTLIQTLDEPQKPSDPAR
ncbi:MAG: secretin N-terminal domain-containing protein [Planctomycetaceae bacterium]|nr:secretin N-terminal domain-containing protein [Planctomycetaceae bacterium]